METVMERITPSIATKYLEMNTHNRPIRQRHVEFLVNEIKTGKWKENGSTIVFNGEKLIDGQHRLWAVLTAGMAIKSLVVRGAEDNSFSTIDTGHQRSAGDILHIAGKNNPLGLASAARFCMDYIDGKLFRRDRRANAAILAFCDANPGLSESYEFNQQTKGNRVISVSMAAALHFLMSKKDKALADELFTGIFKGFASESSGPFAALREKLIACATATSYVDARVVAMYIIRAWNARRAGESIRLFRFLAGEKQLKIK